MANEKTPRPDEKRTGQGQKPAPENKPEADNKPEDRSKPTGQTKR